MPSFDVTSKVEIQLLDNAINVAKKEITTRFDFRNSKTEIELDKKNFLINITTENDMRLDSIIDVLRSRMIKQKLDPRCLDESKEHYPSGMFVKKELKVKNGLDKEAARKINADIKTAKLKVTAQVMDDIIRVSAKKIDDLQSVIALLRSKDYEQPLQFVNMK
ncbi:MAG: YajQ family cyclic di-GMP-binding protein [Bacteroidetes bacterium]|nr:YajQ family cyclic di-GMP-binding protein [Bacteroidota bacterium]